MWISKKEYEDLLDYKDRYVEEYKTVSRLRDDITYYKSEYRELEEEIDELERQLEEYKQKYADEVEKRIKLANYITCIPVTVPDMSESEMKSMMDAIQKHKILMREE